MLEPADGRTGGPSAAVGRRPRRAPQRRAVGGRSRRAGPVGHGRAARRRGRRPLRRRQDEVAEANRIVDDEVERYRVASRARDAAPMVSALRARVEEARRRRVRPAAGEAVRPVRRRVGTGRRGDPGHGGQAAPPADRGAQGRRRTPRGASGWSRRSEPCSTSSRWPGGACGDAGRTGPLRLATRGSPLALWQAHRVAALLEAHRRRRPRWWWWRRRATAARRPPRPARRPGRLRQGGPGGGGRGPSRRRGALGQGPARPPPSSPSPGLVLAAFPERADPRDVLVGGRLDALAGRIHWSPPVRPGAGPSWPTSVPT